METTLKKIRESYDEQEAEKLLDRIETEQNQTDKENVYEHSTS